MIYDNVGGIRNPFWSRSGTWVLQKKNNKDISILIETHVTHDQRHHQIHIRNNWLGSIFFCPGDFHTKDRLSCFVGVLRISLKLTLTEKEGLCLLRLLHSLYDRILCIYALSGYSTREQSARGSFLKEVQNYIETKNQGNENKIILGDFNCTMEKMDRYAGN